MNTRTRRGEVADVQPNMAANITRVFALIGAAAVVTQVVIDKASVLRGWISDRADKKAIRWQEATLAFVMNRPTGTAEPAGPTRNPAEDARLLAEFDIFADILADSGMSFSDPDPVSD